MQRSALAGLLLATLVTSGCLGSVSPAGIPQDTLTSESWEQTKDDQQSLAFGLAELRVRDYKPTNDPTGFGAGVTVATLNDIPILDERERLVPLAIERVEQEKGVSFEDPTSRTVSLSNLGVQTEATEYTVRGAPGEAKALIITPSCGDFVVVAAWGSLSAIQSGLFADDQTWYQMAQRVGRAVDC